ncbi:MAG: T9SS type A sorting domain-containing protein [Prevotellaceae bacterium]|jgi:hypothetical protein|nr:T9SS type A sorting domain-containing protein [Prevotellaceae bacterium]
MKRTIFILISTFYILTSAFAQHVVPTPDCAEAGFSVQVKRYNLEPREWTAYSSRVLCQLPDFDMNATLVQKNTYGSRMDRRVTATGFFRTEKIGDRWWLIDPNGYLHFDVGVCAVNKNSSPRNQAAYAAKYNSNRTNWMRATKDSLKHYGFYSLTAWTEEANVMVDKAASPRGYTPIFNFNSNYNSRRKDANYSSNGYGNTALKTPSGISLHFFDAEFQAFCNHYARSKCQPLANDKDIIGWFSDNELPFTTHTLIKFLQVNDNAYEGFVAAKNYVESKGFSVNDVINGNTPAGASLSLSKLKSNWFYVLVNRYYSCVKNAMRQYVPNHLYIGSRLHIPNSEEPGILQAANENLDVVSLNTYRVWYHSREKAEFWEQYIDKPFLVTEFYAKGEDVFDSQGNKFGNTSGAGWVVHTQTERGYFYQTFCLGMLEAKNCVGWHHFKYMDNDPEDPGQSDPSNIDSNKGLVDNDYDYYNGMIVLAKQLNDRLYNLLDYFDGRYKNPEPEGNIVSIEPEADANYKNSTNEGTAQNLAIKEADPYRQALVRFDITSMPENFAWAGFRIVSTRTITDPQTNYYTIEVVDNNSWSETGLTKNNIPASSYLYYYSWHQNTSIVANVTSAVRKAKQLGKTKITFKIRASIQGTPDYISFGSRENSDPAKRPQLQYAMQIAADTDDNIIFNDNNLKIYPNPVVDKFIINNEQLTINNVEIYDISGRKMNNFQFHRQTNSMENYQFNIDVSALSNGIYFVSAGNKTGKFIKKTHNNNR